MCGGGGGGGGGDEKLIRCGKFYIVVDLDATCWFTNCCLLWDECNH